MRKLDQEIRYFVIIEIPWCRSTENRMKRAYSAVWLSKYCRIILIREGQCSGGSNIFPGSWGRDFVERKFGIILIKMKQMLVYSFVGI